MYRFSEYEIVIDTNNWKKVECISGILIRNEKNVEKLFEKYYDDI